MSSNRSEKAKMLEHAARDPYAAIEKILVTSREKGPHRQVSQRENGGDPSYPKKERSKPLQSTQRS